jgi:hypothetical protein
MAIKHEHDEIPSDICKSTFLSISKGIMVLWVLAGLALSGAGTAIGWAMSADRQLVELKTNQDQLQTQINEKLDFLIKQGVK